MNTNLLKARMYEYGLNDRSMSNILGINTATFYRKKNGTSDFLRREIQVMRETLHLSPEDVDAIFFGQELAEMQVQELQ